MRSRISGGDPQRRRYWQDVVRRWREGGQSVRAFCRAEGLRESAFYFWRRELVRRGDRARRQPQATSSSPAFLPVKLVGDNPAAAVQGIEIVLPRGRVVRVRAGFDRQALAEVLAVLEARPC
jgi:transposase-like protein